MKKKLLITLLILLTFPINIYAYSERIIVGGETIGMNFYSKGVYIVGHYKVNNKYISKEAGFKIGDIITEINNKQINNINDINNTINEAGKYTFKILRDNTTKTITVNLDKEDNIIKTGLYIKDQITGIGTLSYIDPNTKIFGSLGHEVVEANSLQKFEIVNGNIYKAEVKNITRSSDGIAGSKNATIDKDEILGEINSNEETGVYGIYTSDLDNYETMEIADSEEINQGEAYIRTVIKDNEVNDYKINIITIEDNPTKNILFEITDENLLKASGGIVQGMSGSPIIQNNKIIGVVNYVIVNDVTKGYGIFIKSMLEDGDKSNS